MVAQVPTMVAPEDDNGVFREPLGVECIEDFADLRIGVAHSRIVAVEELQSQIVG